MFGYSWVALLHTLGGMSLSATLLLANTTCLAWLAILHFLLRPPKGPPVPGGSPFRLHILCLSGMHPLLGCPMLVLLWQFCTLAVC